MTEAQVAAIVAAIEGASMLELAGIVSLANGRLSALQGPPVPRQGSDTPASKAPIPLRASGADSVKVYAAGAPGLLTLCQDLGRTQVHKVGTTRQADPLLRIGELSRIQYGAFDQQRNVMRPGFGCYVRIPFRLNGTEELPAGIRHVDGCFEVDLVGEMTHSSFEAAFQRAMRPHALMSWAASPQGQAQLAASRMSPADLPSTTRLAGRLVRADEFYVIQPRHQAELVLGAIIGALRSQRKSDWVASRAPPLRPTPGRRH